MSAWIDLRVAARSLRATPGQTLAAVLALALGVAAAVSLYTVFRVIADDLPPIPQPERVARLYVADETTPMGWRMARAAERAGLVDQVAGRITSSAVRGGSVEITIDGCAREDREVEAQRVEPAYFEVAGVSPQIGRAWRAADLRDRAPAILSADFWRRACAASPAVVGLTAWVNHRPYEISGVMPDGFRLESFDVAVWLPLETMRPDETVTIYARLTGGTWQDVNDRFAAFAGLDRGLAVALTDPRIRRGRIALVGLLGPALLVLLVACGNAAALLVGRALQRHRDLAVRLSIGATPWRLARQAFAESAIVAAVAGLAALPLATAGAWALRRAFSVASPSMARTIAIDGGALAVGLLFVCVTALATGLLPAVKAARSDVTALLARRPGAAIVRRGHYTAADLLVVLQVGLAVVLLVVTSMFLRLVGEIVAMVPEPRNATFVAEAATPDGAVPGADRLRLLADELRTVPGVARVSVMDHMPDPPVSVYGTPVDVLGARADAAPCRAGVSAVTGDYFETFSVRLRAGSLFTGWEPAGAPRVAVVSEWLARQCWGRADVVGRELGLGRKGEAAWLVIGVVSDLLPDTRIQPRPAELYVPFGQFPADGAVMLVETRSAAGMADRLSAAMEAPDLRRARWLTLAERNARNADQVQMLPRVLQALAVIALVLATLGVYASILQSLARDKRGLAIRLTLGAQPARLVAVGVSRQALLALIGVLAGAIVTVATTKQVFAELLAITAPDPRLWLAICAPLAACALLASLGPALRIVRLDPMAVLRRAEE